MRGSPSIALRAADPHPPAPSPIKREGEQNEEALKVYCVAGAKAGRETRVGAELHVTDCWYRMALNRD